MHPTKALVRLYDFDGIDERLDLLPLAARRALDLAGRKLGREGFRSLPLDSRRALVELGAQEEVDIARVLSLLSQAEPAPETLPPRPDPNTDRVPAEVSNVLGPNRPLSDKVWETLSSIDRYSLQKTCERNRAERVEAAYREIVGFTARSTHLGPDGDARMVRISKKVSTSRRALAESWVDLGREAFLELASATGKKGDVLAASRIAGIMATKRTSDLIPLCHPIALTHAEVRFESQPSDCRLRVLCEVECVGPTGVEMEALMGASIAALTVYDMLKSTNRAMTLGPTRLLEKSGGRSGRFQRRPAENDESR
jgi:cyclic pyranopterin phosphate synthase